MLQAADWLAKNQLASGSAKLTGTACLSIAEFASGLCAPVASSTGMQQVEHSGECSVAVVVHQKRCIDKSDRSVVAWPDNFEAALSAGTLRCQGRSEPHQPDEHAAAQ